MDRVRAITDSLVPPYRGREDFRVYVVANKEWNAMAAPNGAIFVFSGLLQDMDDDEVAIVLGHELVHATHEHSRKGFKERLVWMIADAAGVVAAAEGIDSDVEARRGAARCDAGGDARSTTATAGPTRTRPTAWGSATPTRAATSVDEGATAVEPLRAEVRRREQGVNFFFSDHSLSAARATKLEEEIAINYPDGPKPGGPARHADRPPSAPTIVALASVAVPAGAQALATAPGPVAPAAALAGASRPAAGEPCRDQARA